MRRASRKVKAESKMGMGSLLTKSAYAKIKQGVPCRPEQEDCTDFTSSILHGTRGSLVFRSTNPRFKMQIPINKETLIGEYAGAIRWSPFTGKLHLCYGHIFDGETPTEEGRPLLSGIVEPDVAKKLWAWYQNSGSALFKKRRHNYEDDVAHRYADIYGLPGATVQLSFQEVLKLDAELKQASIGGDRSGIAQLAIAPVECPPFLGEECNNKEAMMPAGAEYEFNAEFSQGAGPSSRTRSTRSSPPPPAVFTVGDDGPFTTYNASTKKKSPRS